MTPSSRTTPINLPHLAQTAAPGTIREVPRERTQFRALLASNPNYFGNLAQAQSPASIVALNKTYEAIGCVGFHPDAQRLDAVVFVNQPIGYGGNVCSKGSIEYVRFYLSFNGGATWIDQGATGFTVYDVPEGTSGAKRLEFSTSVPCSPPRKWCLFENIVKARAILSWNVEPPANTPNYKPVWGDVHDTWIQVDSFKLIKPLDILELAKIQLPPEALSLFDPETPITLAEKPQLNLAQLHELYADKNIEPHRYALADLHALTDGAASSSALTSAAHANAFGSLNIDLESVLEALEGAGDGNTSYEQLECVGYDPIKSELSGVIRTKKPNGYSGGLCTNGSIEYVTFWADFNHNGTFETCLGTASVRTHDMHDMPKEGLEYAVFLPVDVNKFRKPCKEGPVVVRIRAVLSWNVAPPCANPNYKPVWGNREETLIHIPPGEAVLPGDFKPYLYDVSGQPVCGIDAFTGYASGQRPFGGALYITGEIPAALGIPTPDRLKYKIEVRERPVVGPAGSWQTVGNAFGITVHESIGINVNSYGINQTTDADGFYTYREYGSGSTGNWRRVTSLNRLLAVWNTAQPMTGRWEIRVSAKDTLTDVVYTAGVTHCTDGSTRQNAIVRLDEAVPTGSINITSYSTDGGATWQAAVDCATFEVGIRLRGNYSVGDAHFGSLSIHVEPASYANGAMPVPNSRVFGAPDFVPTNGEASTWELDTTGMTPCGYVVRMDFYDRTIVSGGGGWHDYASVGFCLKANGR